MSSCEKLKGAHIVEYSPNKMLYAPARGGVTSYSVLEPGNSYCLIEDTAKAFRNSDPHAELKYMPDKYEYKDMKELSILFPGGIGDVICLKSCLQLIDMDKSIYPKLEKINVFSTKDDIPIIIDGVIKRVDITVFNYPPLSNHLKSSDAVIGFGALQRQSQKNELSDTMADILGIPHPKFHAELRPRKKYIDIFKNFIPNNGKKNIGIHVYSSSFYRSIPPQMGIWMAMELAELGFNVFMLGSNGQKIKLFDKEGLCDMPDNIYDMSGIYDPLDETVSFISLLDGIICPDTSIVHIAGCLDIPTVALFGPTSGEWRTGYYPTVIPMSAKVDCAPCLNLINPQACGKKFCDAITQLKTKDIINMLLKIMNKGR